jgi:hypothetical protein
MYGCFYVDDMHYRLTALKNDGEGASGSMAGSDFVKQTYNFRKLHDEYSCIAYPGNPLFQRRFWRE